MKRRWISYANYQFWVFAVGGALFALAYGTVWTPRPRTTAPYELGVALDPSYALGHYNIGVSAQAAKRPEVAIDHYRTALAADPHDHTPCFNLAQVALRLEKLDEALTAARCAVDHDDSAEAYDVLGQVLLAQKHEADAIAALDEALRRNPGLAAARLDLGVALASSNKPDEAEASLRAAVAQRPDLAEAWFNLGLIAWHRNDTELAYADFQTAVAMDPQQMRALGNLAFLDADAGRKRAALYWVDRVLALDPANEAALKTRAELTR